MHTWRKIQENGLIEYARKDINEGDDEQDKEFWVKIKDSFLAEFGLSKEYERILELKLDIADMECDLVISDNAFLQNKIRHLNAELEELRDRGVEGDMDDCIHYIEMWRKIEINEMTMKVRKFFKLLKTYKDESKKRTKKSE